MGITEENFVSSVIEGNEQGIEYIIKQYGWVIKTVIKKHLYNLPEYEEECMNDVLLAVWNNIDRYDKDKSTFKKWLAGVSRFTALNYVRKYKQDTEQESIDNVMLVDEKTPHEIMDDGHGQIERDFQEILGCLKEEDKKLFIDLYIKDYSIQEISEETGIKKDVIYNRVSRAKHKIRRLFNQKGGKFGG